MSFKEDIKAKDYFMKDYTRAEVVKTFKTIISRCGRTGEIEGELEDIKIVQINGKIITVETKMKDSNDIRLYRMSLEFPQMENEEFSREAKIASPERVGEIKELKINGNEEKIKYFEEKIDFWNNQEEIEKRIEREINTSNFIESYTKGKIIEITDIMIKNSSKSGDILGDVLESKIVEIDGTTVSVAIKTKDDEIVRIYRINLEFNKMEKIGFTDEAKINSPMRKCSTKELQTSMSDKEKLEYYDRLPNFWEGNREEQEQGK